MRIATQSIIVDPTVFVPVYKECIQFSIMKPIGKTMHQETERALANLRELVKTFTDINLFVEPPSIWTPEHRSGLCTTRVYLCRMSAEATDLRTLQNNLTALGYSNFKRS